MEISNAGKLKKPLNCKFSNIIFTNEIIKMTNPNTKASVSMPFVKSDNNSQTKPIKSISLGTEHQIKMKANLKAWSDNQSIYTDSTLNNDHYELPKLNSNSLIYKRAIGVQSKRQTKSFQINPTNNLNLESSASPYSFTHLKASSRQLPKVSSTWKTPFIKHHEDSLIKKAIHSRFKLRQIPNMSTIISKDYSFLSSTSTISSIKCVCYYARVMQ